MNNKDEIIKSFITLTEMLTDRGIKNVSDHILFGEEEVAAIINNKYVFNIDVNEREVRIIYNINNKLKFNDIKKFFEDEFTTYIVISKDKINANETKKFDELKVDYQTFELKDLQFNISKHVYVPKHELITDETIINDIVHNKYQLRSKNQLPLILKSDPMAKYLHAKPGNIIKVTRYSPTSGEHIVYRCCV